MTKYGQNPLRGFRGVAFKKSCDGRTDTQTHGHRYFCVPFCIAAGGNVKKMNGHSETQQMTSI